MLNSALLLLNRLESWVRQSYILAKQSSRKIARAIAFEKFTNNDHHWMSGSERKVRSYQTPHNGSNKERCVIINNYWMRLSMISWIIKTEVCVICRSRLIKTEVLIIHDIMRKPNSIIFLLYIFHIIHPQKKKRSVQPSCFCGEHSKGLSNQADVELDMINAISAADNAFIMSSSRAIVNWMNALDQSDFS